MTRSVQHYCTRCGTKHVNHPAYCKAKKVASVKHADYPMSRLNKSEPETTLIYVWPDGEWCYTDELHEYQDKSDDYLLIPVDASLDEEQVGVLVMNTYNPSQTTSHPEEHY